MKLFKDEEKVLIFVQAAYEKNEEINKIWERQKKHEKKDRQTA